VPHTNPREIFASWPRRSIPRTEGPAAKRRMAIDDMPRGFAPGIGEERRGEERE
jgi:hypothetical protein